MAASQSLDQTAEHGGVIARLSHELRVPLHEVRKIYGAQLERLTADARIQKFLGVLALRNTRDILRADGRRIGPARPT
jgi:signal transduction histidine kinase